MKRRLQLMPEVLPAPNKTSTSAVRERTMARLRVLAAVGAGIAAACGGATSGGDGKGSSSGGGGGPDGGLPDGNKPDSDPGYGVVDPLPAPACFDYATPPTATASFVTVEDAGVDASADPSSGTKPRYARVIVTLNQKDVAIGDVTIDDSAGISVVEKTLNAGQIELVLRQPPEASGSPFRTAVQIQTSCAKGPTRVNVNISETAGALTTQVSFYGEG